MFGKTARKPKIADGKLKFGARADVPTNGRTNDTTNDKIILGDSCS